MLKLVIAFQATTKIPKTRLYCLIFEYVSFGEEKKKIKTKIRCVTWCDILGIFIDVFFSHNTAPVVRGEDGRLRHGLVVVMTCVLYLPLWMLSPLSRFFMSSSTRYHHFDLKISFMLHKIR